MLVGVRGGRAWQSKKARGAELGTETHSGKGGTGKETVGSDRGQAPGTHEGVYTRPLVTRQLG